MYRFGPFLIDPRERLLRRGDVVLPLTPKAVDTLLALVEARGRLVEKDELMNRLWPGTFVEEANLTNQISLLRKAVMTRRTSRQFRSADTGSSAQSRMPASRLRPAGGSSCRCSSPPS